MFPKLDEELHFGFQRNGSLVIARGAEEEKVLQELMERGSVNGVKRLRILTKEEVFALEPHLNDDVTAALYSPDAGNMIPYEYAIALAENAVDNGVELRIRFVAFLRDSAPPHDCFATADESSNRSRKLPTVTSTSLLSIGNPKSTLRRWTPSARKTKKRTSSTRLSRH
jgi:glycine/D-amino acid oxidase-like deaminating enzyme